MRNFFSTITIPLFSWILLSLILFSLFWALPSDPIAFLVEKTSMLGFSHTTSTTQKNQSLQKEWRANGTYFEQMRNFYGSLVKGTWGTSLWTGKPVSELLIERSGPTLSIALTSVFFTYLLGIFLGGLQFGLADCFTGFLLKVISTLLLCTPGFCICILLFVSLPEMNPLVLAVFIHALSAYPYLAFLLEQRLREEAHRPYFQVAIAKGASKNQVVLRHLSRSTYAVLLSYLPFWWTLFIGTSIIIEPVLQIGGLGLLAFQAFRNQDIPVLLGLSLVFGTTRLFLGWLRDRLFEKSHAFWLGASFNDH